MFRCLGLAVAVLLSQASPGNTAAPPDEGRAFESQVLPILKAHCFACHDQHE